MLDTETTRAIASEAVGAAMRVATADAEGGRISYVTLTEADRHILSDLAARLAHRSALVQGVTQGKPAAERDMAEQAWRFCFVRGYLLALADAGHVADAPRSAEVLAAAALDALQAIWAARGEATL